MTAERLTAAGTPFPAPQENGDGRVMWSPTADGSSRMAEFMSWAAERGGPDGTDYHALWRWSVDELDEFWEAVWNFFEVCSHAPYDEVRSGQTMPDVCWFPGATLNYAEHALTRRDDHPALIARSQTRPEQRLTYRELGEAVARAAAGLRRLGVGRGDRVAAYLPNCLEAVVGFLATAAVGAVWSSCAPEFGVQSVVDRFAQIEPTVLLAVDGYRYGEKAVDRSGDVHTIVANLPSLTATVVVSYLSDGAPLLTLPGGMSWQALVEEPAAPAYEPVPFEHPLYILYSSGTTGIPKAIVHGHGGILLEHLKMLALHLDIHPGDRFFWFSTTGWMMWNYLVSGLLVDATIVLFDGDPIYPSSDLLWATADELALTHFGVSAGYLASCRQRRLRPRSNYHLASLRHIGSTGSPLAGEEYDWVYEHVKPDVVLGSASGGSDVCSAFVASAPLLPVYRGEISCRCLGADVAAFDETGNPVDGVRGELVVTQPLPSMPIGLWGDPSGGRLRASYFDTYPGVWRHGDWIQFTERGSCVITGRSDATLNRGGVRMGTAEFYRVVEQVPSVRDALVVHLDEPDSDRLCLFVSLTPGTTLSEGLRDAIVQAIRTQLSPRYTPDEVIAVPEIPRTLTGKKLEVPIKHLLQGQPAEHVVNRGSLANPESVEALSRAVGGRGQ